MDFNFKPSLQFMALVKTTTALWCHSSVIALIEGFPFEVRPQDKIGEFPFNLIGLEKRRQWQVVEDKVLENASDLESRICPEQSILKFIKPIGLEILKWMEYHLNFLGETHVKRGLRRLVWTPHGTVNKKKTAEIITGDETLHVIQRYRLACIYCLENEIQELWKKIVADRQNIYYDFDAENDDIVALFTYDLMEDRARIRDRILSTRDDPCPYKYAFYCACSEINKTAAEFFLQKMSPEKRNDAFHNGIMPFTTRYRCNFGFLPTDCDADFLFFLLSIIGEEQCVALFQSQNFQILPCLLDWPCQSFFVEVVNSAWHFISDYDFLNLLIRLSFKVSIGYKDWNYQTLIGELWQKCAPIKKQYIIYRCTVDNILNSLLQYLLITEDTKNMALIIKDATPDERIKMLFCHKSVCEDLMFNNRWDTLTFFCGKCFSSMDRLNEFQEELENSVKVSFLCRTPEYKKVMLNKIKKIFEDLKSFE